MTIKSRNELKPRFNTGQYPTQDDFYNVFDSYYHKTDRIPVASVDGINDLLNSNNANLLKEVQKVVDSYHAVDYIEQDLLNVVITPFKHGLSIHKLSEDTEVGFADMSGQIGSVKLIVENIGDTDITLTIEENASLIVFADAESIPLAKSCFVEIILTGYGDYQSLCYRISKAKKEDPLVLPEYIKGEEKNMYLETAAQYQAYGCNWDAASLSFGTGNPNLGTYPYIRVGEYEWMTRNFRINPVEGRIWDKWRNTQALIDASIEKGNYDAMTLDQSLQYEGAFLGSSMGGNEVDALFTNTTFYTDNTKTQKLTGWKQPSVADFAQLFSMADTLDYNGIVAFHGVEKDNPKYPFKNDWQNVAKNTSGFSMIPCGSRNNVTGVYTNPRRSCAFKTDVDNGAIVRVEVALSMPASIIVDNNDNINSIYPEASMKFHLVSVRYCRPLTDEELGYKMYIDRANDRIIVVALNSPQPTDLTELEKGKLRGRAVRWLNTDKTKVIAPLSHIEKELEATQNGGDAGWFGF